MDRKRRNQLALFALGTNRVIGNFYFILRFIGLINIIGDQLTDQSDILFAMPVG